MPGWVCKEKLAGASNDSLGRSSTSLAMATFALGSWERNPFRLELAAPVPPGTSSRDRLAQANREAACQPRSAGSSSTFLTSPVLLLRLLLAGNHLQAALPPAWRGWLRKSLIAGRPCLAPAPCLLCKAGSSGAERGHPCRTPSPRERYACHGCLLTLSHCLCRQKS